MECIKCDIDNKLKERTANSGKCKNCGHQFVFEPNKVHSQFKFTDKFFANQINKISANNTLFFTKKQFLYYFDRACKNTLNSLWSSNLHWGVIIFGVLAFLSLQEIPSDLAHFHLGDAFKHIICIPIFTGLAYLCLQSMINQYSSRKELLASSKIAEWLNKWSEVNGEIERLLPTPKLETNLNKINKDVIKYSFDRIIVCEKDEIAQFLIANNFHFENNCAIVSINGYPQNIFETVMEMVKRNPNLKIYTLHDASSNGIKILNTLKTKSDWFADNNAVIYDICLLPRQIFKTKNLSIQQSNNSAILAKNLSNTIKKCLSNKEINWLKSGKIIELESFSPQKLIQIVTLAIAKNKVSETTVNYSEIYLDSTINYETIIELDTFG